MTNPNDSEGWKPVKLGNPLKEHAEIMMEYPYFDGVFRSRMGRYGLEPGKRKLKYPCTVRPGETLWMVFRKLPISNPKSND